MSKFYVGQRVRVVDAHDADARLQVEKETVITHIGGQNFAGETLNRTDIPAPDCGIFVPFFSFRDHELKPLADPGREFVSWETCTWKPEHLREVVA